jgi:hypothetical protein
MFQGEAHEHVRALYVGSVAYCPQALHSLMPNFSHNAPRVTAAFSNSVFFLPLGFTFFRRHQAYQCCYTSFRHKIRFVSHLENKFQSKNKCTHQLVPNVSRFPYLLIYLSMLCPTSSLVAGALFFPMSLLQSSTWLASTVHVVPHSWHMF